MPKIYRLKTKPLPPPVNKHLTDRQLKKVELMIKVFGLDISAASDLAINKAFDHSIFRFPPIAVEYAEWLMAKLNAPGTL